QCVIRTASRCLRPKRSACCRKSDEVSTRTVRPACSTITDTRRRLSLGSSEVQVSHSQPIEGTPVEVPVPRKVNRIIVGRYRLRLSNRFSISHFPCVIFSLETRIHGQSGNQAGRLTSLVQCPMSNVQCPPT